MNHQVEYTQESTTTQTINTENEYLKAVNEITNNQTSDYCDSVIPDAHWWTDTERKSIVLANDRDQYVIPFHTIDSAEGLHRWVEHLSHKNWVGKGTLEDLVAVWQQWIGGKTVARTLVNFRTRTIPENGMLASEVYATWLRNGVSGNILKDDLLVLNLHRGDYRISTTPELMAISESFEHDTTRTNNPPELCASCKDTGLDSHVDWTYGHRPGWWVCAQCNTVWACRCRTFDEDGNCDYCGRKGGGEAVAAYNNGKAREWAYARSLECKPRYFNSEEEAEAFRRLEREEHLRLKQLLEMI
ncbi:MAG: hypothetical protein WAN65_03505 [Candidatus Sulfotelmatobacter sp.]